MNTHYDVLVIGGGPSGMMAASVAGKRGRKTLLIEKNPTLGKKLSITGGGRCNVTNNKPAVRTMLEAYKSAGKFLFSTFSQHGVRETIDWFSATHVTLVEENEGRLFPSTHKAETIRATLEEAVRTSNVTIKTSTAVTSVTKDEHFTIHTTKGIFTADACIVATGGTSRPETGSTGEGFAWLSALGHTVEAQSYSLVPITTHDRWVAQVSGVTLPDIKITLYADDQKIQTVPGKVLFTHTGLSGPTILNLSSTIGELLTHSTVTIALDLFPAHDIGSLRNHLTQHLEVHSNKKIHNSLSELIPRGLGTCILEILKIDGETPGHSLSKDDRTRLVATLKHLPLRIKGLLGADKAVISGGGVALPEINFKTMESRIVPKLYLIGDILNIDRPSGGYSLQLCWSTGYVAGNTA